MKGRRFVLVGREQIRVSSFMRSRAVRARSGGGSRRPGNGLFRFRSATHLVAVQMYMNHSGGREAIQVYDKPRDLCERTACPTYIQPRLALLVFTGLEGFVLAETLRNWCRRSACRNWKNSNQSPTILPPSSPLIANGGPKWFQPRLKGRVRNESCRRNGGRTPQGTAG